MTNGPERVFVYGTLRRDGANQRMMRSARNLGMHTTGPGYTIVDLGAYPGVIEAGETPIIGEVYAVGRRLLARLDALEDYPVAYTRKQIDTDYGPAWMYLYRHPRPKGKIILSGDWNKRGLGLRVERSELDPADFVLSPQSFPPNIPSSRNRRLR